MTQLQNPREPQSARESRGPATNSIQTVGQTPINHSPPERIC